MITAQETYDAIQAFIHEKEYVDNRIVYTMRYNNLDEKRMEYLYTLDDFKIAADRMNVCVSYTGDVNVWFYNSCVGERPRLYETRINTIKEFTEFLHINLSERTQRQPVFYPDDKRLPSLYETLDRVIDVVDTLHRKRNIS